MSCHELSGININRHELSWIFTWVHMFPSKTVYKYTSMQEHNLTSIHVHHFTKTHVHITLLHKYSYSQVYNYKYTSTNYTGTEFKSAQVDKDTSIEVHK